MPGRTYTNGTGYRYGFNGQEKSIDIDPNGNSMTAEFWQYDARIGRRWNIDPRAMFEPASGSAGNPSVVKSEFQTAVNMEMKSFYSIQNTSDTMRLISGGNPWPTGLTRAQFGVGFYAWATEAEAQTYLQALKSSGVKEQLHVMEFNISRTGLDNFRRITVSENELSNSFLRTFSIAYGKGLPHTFEYIKSNNIGTEHYFNSNIFFDFNFKAVK